MLNITTLGQRSYLILISIVLSVVFASSLILIKKPKRNIIKLGKIMDAIRNKNVIYSYTEF